MEGGEEHVGERMNKEARKRSYKEKNCRVTFPY